MKKTIVLLALAALGSAAAQAPGKATSGAKSPAVRRAKPARPAASAKIAPQKSKEVVELEALEIKAKLQEPTLMYILEQPYFEIDFVDEPDFLRRAAEPIEENAL